MLLDLDPDRVLVAVDPHLDDALDVAGALALLPQRLARAAEVPGLAGLDRCAAQRLGVHVRDHQHVAGRGVGGDAGDEPVGVELRREGEAFLDRFGRADAVLRMIDCSAKRMPHAIAAGEACTDQRSAAAHHGDEAHLLVRIVPERCRGTAW